MKKLFILSVYKLFQGRMDRVNFLKSWFMMITGFIFVLFSLVGNFSPEPNYYMSFRTDDFSYITALFLFVLQVSWALWILLMISILVRRWHDIGYGSWLLLFLVPISFIPIVFLFVLFLPSDANENEYGAVQKSNWSVDILLNKNIP